MVTSSEWEEAPLHSCSPDLIDISLCQMICIKHDVNPCASPECINKLAIIPHAKINEVNCST